MRPLTLVLAGLLVAVAAARADDPPSAPLPPEIVAQLAEMRRLSEAGVKAYAAGKFDDAREPLERALAVARRLHGTADHPNVAGGLANLGAVAQARGRPAEAEPLYRESLAMRRRLSKGRDDPLVALTLSNLARALKGLGKFAEAEPLCREALAMRRRLLPDGDHLDVALALGDLAGALEHRGKVTEAEPLLRDALGMYRRLSKDRDHPNVASGLSSLADALDRLGRPADAEPLFRDALGMYRRLHGGADHPAVALALANLADLLRSRGEYAEAEPLFREALGMYRRLHGGADHPNVAAALNNLATLLAARGKPAEAEPLCREVLAMRRRLHTGDHPEVATALNNLAFTLAGRGKPADAEPLFRDALAAYRALARASAAGGSEGDALTYAASFPLARDAFLSVARANHSDPTGVYTEVWADKGHLTRAFERRALAARAAATNPEAAAVLDALTDARRRRAEMILAPVPKDPATAKLRDAELAGFADTIRVKAPAFAKLFPPVDRADQLAAATPADIQKVLPPGTVVVDSLRYTRFEFDPAQPGKAGERRTRSYTAFVITKDKVAWVDLGPAKPIEEAVGRWRAAVTADPPAPVPADLARRVRELVWEPVRKEFPAGVKTVYVAPDAELTKVPWAALPGDKPNTVLLEDFAVATLPHAPYLLDTLWPQGPRPNRPDGLLAVGGVPFGGRPASAGLTTALASAARRRDGPAVAPDKALVWKDLPGAAAEAEAVAAAAARKGLPARRLAGPEASADRLLAELPKARYAHLATHGFFADPSFRGLSQLDPKLFTMRGGERVGAAVNNPLVMSGLVLAGANRPDTPGRGIVTGDHLVDRDLSGLDLAVLSACDTGLGDVAGGEGVFGLARAFHVAGCRDVVASLWKVDDQATAALMGEFYRQLWGHDQPPIEALRQAQLAVYRADPKELVAMAKRGPVPGDKDRDDLPPAKPPAAAGKSHPAPWAAFVLSGPGK